jgi:PTS system nitrogen regulatory IIA component
MPLGDLFACTAILAGGPSASKADLIEQLLARLVEAGHLPAASLLGVRDAILSRERLGSTGIGASVALPHAWHPAVTEPMGILATYRAPVEFDSIDGEPVSIIALCLVPPVRPGTHLGRAFPWLEGLTRRLRDADFCRRLREASSAEELAELIETDGGMTRREWLTCRDPAKMLAFLASIPPRNPARPRLASCGCSPVPPCGWPGTV